MPPTAKLLIHILIITGVYI